MPLPESNARKQLHTRTINCEGFQRDDGLWEVDAHLVDVKTYAFEHDYRGTLNPGDPVHEMWIRLAVSEQMVVQDCLAVTDHSPYACCDEINGRFKKLIGEKIGRGWNRRVKELVGGPSSCTHLVDLIAPATTTLFQTMAGLSRGQQGKAGVKPFYIDGCHAWNSHGPQVLKYHPQHFTGKPDKQ